MPSTLFSNLSEEELRALLIKHNINAGPIGPSTRKVYESKLRKILDTDDGSNNVVDENSPDTPAKNSDMSNNNYNLLQRSENDGSPHPSPRKKGDEESDAHSEFEESVRTLSPEEVRKFRSSFSSNPNLRSMEESNKKKVSSNSVKKVSKAKTILTGFAMFMLVGISIGLIAKINWESLTNSLEKDEV